jgi:uncharacterized protein (TIGR04168 family)
MSLKIAVIGDIHDQWEEADNLALEALTVDLALFVGDFGNESVEVVRRIASLNLPKAAIMGNHDAWYSASSWGRKQCPYDQEKENRVQQQLDLLGEAHVGYGKLDIPNLELSIVGSRPFSWGGPEWKNKKFLEARYGITNFEDSSRKIIESVNQSTYNTVIFLGHNGPFGLGEQPEDMCGKDWQPLGGDHGDPDFAEAIAKARQLGKRIPLVTFGHMHHRLRHTKSCFRQRVQECKEGTVYLNAACVPRIQGENGHKIRNFSLVSLLNGLVETISLVWVGEDFTIVSEECLYQMRSDKYLIVKARRSAGVE